MERPHAAALLIIAAATGLLMSCGVVQAQALRNENCRLDRRFDPPRLVCRPKRPDDETSGGYGGGGRGSDGDSGQLVGSSGGGGGSAAGHGWRSGRAGSGGGGGAGSFGGSGANGGGGGSAFGGGGSGDAGSGDAKTGSASTGSSGIGGTRPSPTLQPARALIVPSEMPPKGVAAYGIVAFTTGAVAADRQRFLDVCAAYKSTLIAQSDLAGVPLKEQMITFWPVTERRPGDDAAMPCDAMVDRYDLKAALDAIRDADAKKESYAQRRGPFLIAWSPSESRAKADSVILVIDMSALGSPLSFQETFKSWRQKIIDDPKFWRDGFSVEQVRLALRDTLDRYGAVLLSFLPGEEKAKP